MGNTTAIQWTDHTWNPWHGCTKVSAGCKFCYMYRDKERYGQDPTKVVRASPSTFNSPLRGGAKRWHDGARVFTCSWSDWFIEDADPWRNEAWAIIKQRPGLTFQILTKRPERIAEHLPADWGHGYPNVWLGVSVEDQAAADRRCPILTTIPCAVSFLSVEPLLGAVDLRPWLGDIGELGAWTGFGARVDWVIVGGESGSREKARPCDLRWIESIVYQCSESGVQCFVKQLGSVTARELHLRDGHGGDPREWPTIGVDINVRQFPDASVAST